MTSHFGALLTLRQTRNVCEGCSNTVKQKKHTGSKKYEVKSEWLQIGQEKQKRLQAQQRWDASRLQCERAEHKTHRLQIQNDDNAWWRVTVVERHHDQITVAGLSWAASCTPRHRKIWQLYTGMRKLCSTNKTGCAWNSDLQLPSAQLWRAVLLYQITGFANQCTMICLSSDLSSPDY